MTQNSLTFRAAVAASALFHVAVIAIATHSAQQRPDSSGNGTPLVTLLAPEKPPTPEARAASNSKPGMLFVTESSSASIHAMSHADAYYQKVSDEPVAEPDERYQICEGKDSNFEGVGMIIQPGSNRVISVPVNYPAYKAGIRKGDRIVDPYGPTAKAGFVTFDVESPAGSRRVRIRQAKICYK